jgi:glycosyltransferase involved in cell wall biosynthesis
VRPTEEKGLPRVSVVIPAYRNAQFVAEAIESVLAQTYRDFEIVVADHSSDDGTASVLEKYAAVPKVRVLSPTPAGGGALANWARVTSHSRGELVKLLCGDDLIHPDALMVQVAALDDCPGATMVACQRHVIDVNGRILLRDRGLGPLRGLVSGREAIRATVRAGTNLFGEPGCVLFRRQALSEVGGWSDEFPYLIDLAAYVAILGRGDVVAVPQTLASFRVSSGQWSSRLAAQQASQTRHFFRSLRRDKPGLVSGGDLALAGFRARILSAARRVFLAVLARGK